MIDKARKRNRQYIGQGVAKFFLKDFIEAALPESNFDSVSACNLSLFWKKPEMEIAVIRKILKPGGKLLIVYQAPFAVDDTYLQPTVENLKTSGFTNIETGIRNFAVGNAVSIICRNLLIINIKSKTTYLLKTSAYFFNPFFDCYFRTG